jgi:RNA polymerase sigma-70 factor (ECF subfamily)
MPELEPVAELVKRVQDGDPEAAAQLFARYARQLTSLAEQHLSRRLAGRVDADDVVQSVFRTFFRRNAQGEFTVDGSAPLWQLLVRITVLKARAVARHHAAGIRDVSAEAPTGNSAGFFESIARAPGPEEAAAFVDQVESLVRGLPDLYGDLVRMRLEGHSVSEIASHLGVSCRTVQRALVLLQQRLERANADESA